MTVKDILDFINSVSPLSAAEKYDNVGMLVGDYNAEVTGICTCLDITNDVIDEALKKNANLIVSHHPVIFDPLKNVRAGTPVYKLIKNGISAICVHTNFDMTEGGVNDALLELLGFESAEVLEQIHPNGLGFGAVCDLSFGFTAKGLAEHCKNALYLESVKYCDGGKEIKRVAVCSGSGGSFLEAAAEKGCDALVTGDIKHNIWIDARNMGFSLIDAGHYGTEKCASHRLAALLSRNFGGVPVFAADSDTEPCKYV
ncbi:MAG: Nif3-like dinuclear metal center hexameric protein [Oscillospiraceae bacterium]|nr:Nif3-like dinuclear metal center hexameric protein [Oscillospiraceae bacterium]